MLKIKCPHCTKMLNVPEHYLGKQIKCPNCKQLLTVIVPKEKPKQPPKKLAYGLDIKVVSFWKDFFAFRSMLFPDLIKFGWIICVIGGLVFILIGFSRSVRTGDSLPVLVAMLYSIVVIILTRLTCEFSILFFRINETLTEIRQLLIRQQAK